MSANHVARIAKNALSGAGARIAMMAIGFGLTPFIVHALGLQMFGLWAVVGSLAGYLGLLDFGLGGAFVKFITEYVEQGRKDAARQVICFGMAFYAAFGLVLALPIYFLTPLIVRLFKMPAAQLASAAHLFDVLFAIMIASMILGIPGAAVVAMHRMDLASRNNFAGYLAYAGSTVVFVKLGWGVWGVVAAQGLWVAVSAVLQYVTARRLFGPMWTHPARFERAVIGRIFGFGGWTQANSLLMILNLDVGRFISASIVSVASTAYYEIGGKVGYLSRSLPMYLLDAILPAAAAADARRDEASLVRIYRSGTLYSIFATFGIAGLLIGASEPLVRVWMGQTYPYVSSVILWLAVGYAISGLTGVGTTIFRAVGTPRYETAFTAVSAAANLGSTLFLAPRLGIVGVALGTAVGWTVGTTYFLIVFHRVRRLPWWSTVGASTLRLACAAATATIVVMLGVRTGFAAHLFASRWIGLAGLALTTIVYAVVYAGVAWMLGAFRSDEALLVRRISNLGDVIAARFGLGIDRRAA